MADQQRPDDLAQLRAELAAQRAVTEAQGAEIARLKRRRRLPRRALPVLLAALLVTLVPLATLAASPIFTDLGQAAAVHQPNIQALGDAGITTGADDPAIDDPAYRLYDPQGAVTREQMASFLARAAGLGGNPPVANALTAVNATNAQSASNATTVGGYAPGGLVRTARGSGLILPPATALPASNGQYLVAAQTTLTAPGPGFALVTGTVSTAADGINGVTYANTRLRGASGEASPLVRTVVGTNPEAAYTTPATATWVFPVAAAGEHTFVVETTRLAGAGGIIFNGMITALYVPFGPTGAGTLGTDQP